MSGKLLLKPALELVSVLALIMVSNASAQQKGTLPIIGHFSGSNDASNLGPRFEAFKQGMQNLGYVEGKNILFEHRFAEGNRERIAGLVNELLRLKVDVFLTGNLTAIRAAKRVTQTVPIVMVITPIRLHRDSLIAWRVPAEILPGSPISTAS